MNAHQVDYDRIAPTYNRRFQRDSDAQRGAAAALQALARELDAGRILEVGCGTGRWLADLRPQTPELVGLDFSAGMLQQAQQRDARLALIRGRAGRLPLPPASVDLVYCVNAIHHFEDQAAFVREARRLLRPGGALAVIGMDPRQHRDRWYIYDYFPGAYETDLARFPSWGQVLDWMVAVGLGEIRWQLVEHIVDPKRGRSVLSDPFLEKNAASQLALLSEQAYAQGLACIACAVEMPGGDQLEFPVEILLHMLVGRVIPA